VMEVPTVCSRPMNGADRETRRGPAVDDATAFGSPDGVWKNRLGPGRGLACWGAESVGKCLFPFFFFLVTDRFPGPPWLFSWGWPRRGILLLRRARRRRHSSPAPARPFARLCFRLPDKDRRCVRSKAWLRAHANVQRARGSG
jgi:hypothetical protein